MTNDGRPETGVPGSFRAGEMPTLLLAGDLPAPLVSTLEALSYPLKNLVLGEGVDELAGSSQLVIAVCSDPAIASALHRGGLFAIIGVASPQGETALVRALLAAGASDVISPNLPPQILDDRIHLAFLRHSAPLAGPARDNREAFRIGKIAELAAVLATGAENAINVVLEQMGEGLKIGRTSVLKEHFRPVTEEPLVSRPWHWANPADPAMAFEPLANVPASGISPHLADILRTARNSNGLVSGTYDGRATLGLPLVVQGSYWGALVLESATDHREWAPQEIAVARAACAGITGGITRRRQEETRRDREERFREVFENTNDMVYTTDTQLRFTSANPAVERTLGYRPEEVLGQPLSLIVGPESLPMVHAMFAQKLEGGEESTSYEIMLVRKDGGQVPVEVVTRLTRRDGIITGTQGIARDLTRRVENQRQLQERAEEAQRSEAAFRTLFDKSPQPMLVHDDKTVSILEVNEAACRTYGWSREEFLGRTLYDLRPAGITERARQFFENPDRPEVEDLGTWQHRTASGALIDVRIHTRLIDFRGGPARVAIIEDVTTRVRAEAALRRALRMNDNIMASASDVIVSTDTHGIIEYANQRTFEATGYEPRELVGKHFTLLAPLGQEEELDTFLTNLRETNPVSHTEIPVRRKDGSVRWFEWGIAPLLEDGENLGSVACGHDITPQREAEAEIHRLASLAASSPNAIITATPQGKILAWNAAAERLFGYSAAESLELDLRQVIRTGNDAELFERIYGGATIENVDLRVARQDGSKVEISLTAFPILDTRGAFSLIGLIAMDVTEEKLAARENAQLGAIVQASTEAIVMTDPSGKLTGWNAAAERIFGYTKEEVLGRSLIFLLPPGEAERGLEIGRRLSTGRAIEGFEIRGRRKDGIVLLIDFTAFPIRDNTGMLIALAGIMRDITSQRAQEDVDRERQEVLALAYRSLNIGIFISSEDGVIQSANDESCVQFGRTREQLIGMPYWELLPEETWSRVESLHHQRMATEPGSLGQLREWHVTLPSGEARVMTSVTGRFDRSDGSKFLVLAGADVTSRRDAEEQLARLAAIVASSGDAMMSAGLDGRITTWNNGAEQLFGWRSEEVLGQPMTMFYPPGIADDGHIAIDILKEGGRIDGVETRVVRRDGSPVDISVSLFGVHDATGRLVSVAGVGRDVSEQKRTREELQRRVADLQTLYRLRVRLAEASSDGSILEAGLDALTDVFRAPMASARLANEDGTLDFSVARGLSDAYMELVQTDPSPMMFDLGPNPFAIPSIEQWEGYGLTRGALLSEGIRAALAIPIIGLDLPFGILAVYYREERAFSDEEIEIGQTIAGSVAFAMEQRAARTALQRSIERFEAVAAATKDAIWDLEVATRRIWWSTGFEVLFGYAPEEIEGTLDYWERLIHPDDRESVLQGFDTAIAEAADFWSDEYRFLCADGSYAHIFDRGYIVKDEHGVSYRVIGSMVDITALRKAENDARAQERFMSAILDHSPLAIQVFDDQGYSLRMNEAQRAFIGVPDRSYGVGEFNVLTDQFMVETGLAETFERAYSGETVQARDMILDPAKSSRWDLQGPQRWFDQWVFPVKDDEGNVTAVVALVNDVSERHQSQEDLRTAQQYLQSVISNAPLLMFVWDRDGNFMMAAGAAVSGLIGEETEGGLVNVYHLFADQPDITDAVRRGLEGEETSFEMEYNDSTWDSQYTPMRDERGEINGVIGVSTDISDRKRAELARGLAEQRLLALAESLPIIFFALDADGLLTLATGKGLHSLTEDPASLIGRPLFDMLESREFDQSVARALRGESFTGITPIGEQWFETHFEPIVDESGNVVGTIGVSLDITERRKTEEALLQSQKMESLGILAGGIAHDFNNLLVGIMGNAGLALMELPPDSPARETIEEIEMAGQRAAELARQMLAYSGKGRFVVQRIDLSTLVEEMTQLLRVSITKSAVLDYHFERGLPSVEVDTTQLRQVVMNLVINASDAIGDEDGRITITTGAMYAGRDYLSETYLPQDVQAGEFVYLEIQDTGVGMDAETRGRVFDPFFTTKFTGRGLGLAAVLGIVRGHRGAIKVTSEPGRGTTFRLLLPSAGPPPEPAGNDEIAARTAPRVWRANGTILLADDEATVRSVTARALESFGFRTIRAVDGQDAVELFQKHRAEITCVLMDLTMPRMNGEEALAAILGIDPYVRVVLMSGFAEQEAMGRFAGKGLAGFIQKPYEFEKLRQTLRHVLESPPPAVADHRRANSA